MTFAEAPGAAPTGSKHGAAGWLGALVSKHACHGTATGAALAAGALGKAVSKAAQSEGAAAAGAGATVAGAAAGAGAAA